MLIETLEKYGAAIEIPIYMENDVALNHWTKEFANKEQLFFKTKRRNTFIWKANFKSRVPRLFLFRK
ncbi:hypothetical protein MCOL2_19851 [Listeria fleischmannii FSL S10-1203]|uniref:Uncharacterized protein n=1 Tax=Listeria fleischmannii FSL S10-1203 TaxID=1265822 RepID=W7DAJ1_9LIST|nr:hypothetical protein MCOL2_19851 [Listeria fleischmannii FSL S10-1203]